MKWALLGDCFEFEILTIFLKPWIKNRVQLLTNVKTLFEGFEIKTQLTVL